jgi:hypothetical protein
MQLRSLSADFSRTRSLVTFTGILLGVVAVIGFFVPAVAAISPVILPVIASLVFLVRILEAAGFRAKVMGHVLLAAAAAMGMLTLAAIRFTNVTKFLGVLTGATAFFAKLSKWVGIFFSVLKFGMVVVLKPLLVLLGVFQLISRAVAIANVADMERVPAALAQLSDMLARLKAAVMVIITPFTDMFNAIAEAISPLFRRSIIIKNVLLPVLEGLVWILEQVAYRVAVLWSALLGLATAIISIVTDIFDFNFKGMGGRAADAFLFAYEEQMKNMQAKLGEEEGATVSQVNNLYGGVHINNNIKEAVQPDRIAFTIKEQRVRATQAPTKGRTGMTRGRQFATTTR